MRSERKRNTKRVCSWIPSMYIDLAMPESVKGEGKALRDSTQLTRATENRLQILN